MSLDSAPPADTAEYLDTLLAAVESVHARVGRADVAVVLGSGLNNFVTHLQEPRSVAYSTVPGMPQTTVKGHDGKIVVGDLPGAEGGSSRLMCFAGRVHLYEGWQAHQLHFITRLAARAGCRIIVFTNSAGGALPDMGPGSIMCIRDILRVTNVDPLCEACDDPRFGPRGLQTQGVLSDRLAGIARDVAREEDIALYEGTYAWFSGPTYETHAEVQAGLRLGVGAFGMSTVPEIMAARALGMEVFALSLATNMAAGLADEKLLHADVVRVGREAGPKFERLLLGLCRRAAPDQSGATTEEVAASPAPAAGAGRSLHPRATWQFTPADVSADAAAASARLGGARVASLAIAAEGHGDAAAAALGAAEAEAVPLRELLPRFAERCAQTVSALQGRVRVAAATGAAVLTGTRAEGFSQDEAAFLVAVFARLGAARVLQSLVAGPVEGAGADGAPLLLVTDSIQRVNRRAPLNLDAARGTRRAGPPYDAALVEAAAKAAPAAARGGVTAFPGPTLPTAVEVRSAAPETAAVTVTSLAPSHAAAALGLPAFAVAALAADFCQAGAAAARAASSAADVGAALAAAAAGAAPSEAAAAGAGADAGEGAPVPPLMRAAQENYDHVAEAAAAARKALGLEADADVPAAALVLEGYTGLLKLDAQAACHELPHWEAGPAELARRWTVAVGAAPAGAAGRALYLVAPEPACEGVPPAHELGFGARMLHLMGARAVLMAPRVTSVCDKAAPVGSTVLFRDHINITGVNPLMGLNDERWGTRFPDMGSVYTQKLREAMGGGNAGDAICGLTNEPEVASRAEALFFARLGATVVATGAVPQAIRLGHSEVAVASLGVVDRSAVADAAAPYTGPAALSDDQRRAVLARLAKGVEAAASL